MKILIMVLFSFLISATASATNLQCETESNIGASKDISPVTIQKFTLSAIESETRLKASFDEPTTVRPFEIDTGIAHATFSTDQGKIFKVNFQAMEFLDAAYGSKKSLRGLLIQEVGGESDKNYLRLSITCSVYEEILTR